MNEIQQKLPLLLPRVITWATEQEELIVREGEALSGELLDVARRVEVAHPERIRLHRVEVVPFPEDPELSHIAEQVGLIGSKSAGLTLGYGIYIARRHESLRLLSHEFRHVHQYEKLGGIPGFMPVYLQQLAAAGYRDAELERDAQCHEVGRL